MEPNINDKLSTLDDDVDHSLEVGKRMIRNIFDHIRNYHNKYPHLFYITIIIIVVILVIIVITLIKNKIKWNRENPVFYRTGANVSDQQIIISNDSLHPTPQSNSSSMLFWVNIDSVDLESKSSWTSSGESILDTKYIRIVKLGSANNLKLSFKNQTAPDIIIPDYPMNKWFSISIVIIDNYIEIYIDGKLIKTQFIETDGGIILQGTDNESVKLGSFKGKIASFTSSSITYTARTVNHLQRRGTITNSWLVKMFGFLSDLDTKPKCEKI